jgi:nucleotide-binding universal stress UspA family protein
MTTETTSDVRAVAMSTARGAIVVGVDTSPCSEHAVMWAADEARLQHRGLTIVHAQSRLSTNELAVLATAGIPPRQVTGELHAATRRTTDRARALAAERMPSDQIEAITGLGDARSMLLDLAPTASMVVVGSRGHGSVVGLLLGSVSGALVRHAGTPVVVVRAPQGSGAGVLIAADGSAASLGPVEHAYREASLHQLPLTIVHCLWDGLVPQISWSDVADSHPEAAEARLRIAESIAGMSEKFPEVEVHVRITRGVIDACLVDLSAEYELLVIGRPPRSLGQRLLLTGLTTAVAEHAHSPVLVVP